MNTLRLIAFSLLLMLITNVYGDTTFQPFVLASVGDAPLESQTEQTRQALQNAGFEVAGSYQINPQAHIIVVTHQSLKSLAAQSDKGGYGALVRVSVAQGDEGIEVGFVNPLYLQHAYRMNADLSPIYDQLVAALGHVEDFGAQKKMTASKLAKYHYMFGMQRFDDPYELGEFDSHEAALAAVETGLAAAGDGLSQIYRIDIPGKQQSVFGVRMVASGSDADNEDIDESHQLSIVDFSGPAKVAYFPYEVLVTGNTVEALHMRFRMAVHFPDLSMMGEHGFTQLMSSPAAIGKALEKSVNAP